MTRYDKLMKRIRAGERILIDGGTGTEIERRGVPQLDNAWNGGGALSHPEIVRAVHEDYLRLGAEIVISNNFATNYYALRDAGEADRFEAYNRRGVELAIEARDHLGKSDALVAAGISHWSFSGNHPSLEDFKIASEQQVAILADAGAELILLEMMIDIDRMLILLDAAVAADLPVWVGLSCEIDSQGSPRLQQAGASLITALDAIKDRPVDLINIMHTEVVDVDVCLDVVQANWDGPIGVYAHTGEFVVEDQSWIFTNTITPTDYATAAQKWIGCGVNVIGGCCGIEPRHIEQLAKVIR